MTTPVLTDNLAPTIPLSQRETRWLLERLRDILDQRVDQVLHRLRSWCPGRNLMTGAVRDGCDDLASD